MKYLTLTTIIASLALANLPAQLSAETAEQLKTKQQLAASLDVNPDDFTLLELSQLSCRLDGAENEAERRRILESVDGYGLLPGKGSDESKEQLAASMGVDPSGYTLQELVFLKSLIEEDDCNVSNPEKWAKAGERVTNETAGAKQQLASALGVNAQSYTLVELVKMQFDIDN